MFDSGARAALLSKLVSLGGAIRTAFGGQHQDVEGVVDGNGGVFIVQARPQVLQK